MMVLVMREDQSCSRPEGRVEGQAAEWEVKESGFRGDGCGRKRVNYQNMGSKTPVRAGLICSHWVEQVSLRLLAGLESIEDSDER